MVVRRMNLMRVVVVVVVMIIGNLCWWRTRSREGVCDASFHPKTPLLDSISVIGKYLRRRLSERERVVGFDMVRLN